MAKHRIHKHPKPAAAQLLPPLPSQHMAQTGAHTAQSLFTLPVQMFDLMMGPFSAWLNLLKGNALLLPFHRDYGHSGRHPSSANPRRPS